METWNQKLTASEKEFLDAVNKKQKENPKLQSDEATKLVAAENPQLARRYRSAVLTGHD